MPRPRQLWTPPLSRSIERWSHGRFGDGSDGIVTAGAGVTNLTRTMFYQNFTINAGDSVQLNNYALYVSGSLIINGTLCSFLKSANNFPKDGSGANAFGNGGIGDTSSVNQMLVGSDLQGTGSGTNGGNGGVNAGSGSSNAAGQNAGYDGGVGGNGGTGGTGSGGAGGVAGTGASATFYPLRWLTPHMLLKGGVNALQLRAPHGGLGGAGGSGGGGDGTNFGGGGGGGAAGGGVALIFARHIVVGAAGVIHCDGSDGGQGGGVCAGCSGGTGHGLGNCGGGGGGGAGGGGLLCLCFESLTNGGAIHANGGVGGTGGGKTGTGTVGTNGGNGGSGVVLKFNILSGAYE